MTPIQGDFATYKNVPSRKVLQLVIEVPAEQAGEVFAALGFPVSGESNPVAVAPLGGLSEVDIEPAAKPASEAPSKAENRPSKRTWDEMKASEQAGVLCNNPDFHAFLIEGDFIPPDETRPLSEVAALVVRNFCGVESRAELDNDHPGPLTIWRELEGDFRDWQSSHRETQRYGETVR